MAWLKLDDGFFDHPKVIGLTPHAKLVYLAALAYCSRHATDGRIPREAVASIAVTAGAGSRFRGDSLVRAGLWRAADDGFEVHDYLEHQRSAEQVKRERSANAERVRRWRDRQSSLDFGNAVTEPDGNAVTNGSRVEKKRDSSSSDSDSRPAIKPPVDDDEERFREAAAVLATRRMLARRHVTPKVANEGAWLAAVKANIIEVERERAMRLLAEDPRPSIDELADALERIEVGKAPFVKRPDPKCNRCDGTGWIELTDPHEVKRCDCKSLSKPKETAEA